VGLLRTKSEAEEERFGLNDLMSWFSLDNGLVPGLSWVTSGREVISPGYQGIVAEGYGANAVVFACIGSRMSLFSEARFQFQQLNGGRPGDLFGTPALQILETPWPNGTTGDLLARAEQDASLAGNFFARRIQGPNGEDRLERLRPDWVEIIASDPFNSEDSLGRAGSIDLLSYIYYPGGKGIRTKNGITLMPDEVAHYCPVPDPLAHFRGMSWLTPVIREIEADKGMTKHKAKYFEHAATPNMMVKLAQKLTPESYERLEKQLEQRHGGVENAYRTMILEGGVDATVVGNDFRQMTFTDVQAAGENRIAAAASVPAIIVGLKEGLAASTYSNYGQSMRKFGDHWARPSWRNFAGCMQTLVPPPSGSRLWYDDRDIPAMRQDAKEEADILNSQAAAIRQLIDGGYTPESATKAITSGDLSLLKHSGWLSVQLWLPGQNAGNTGESAKAPAAALPPGAESPKAPGGNVPVPVPANGKAPAPRSDEVSLALTAMRDIAVAPSLTDVFERMASGAREDTNTILEAMLHQGESMKALAEAISRQETTVNVAAPEVTVEQPDITVQAPTVNVQPPEIHVDAPIVNVETPARTKKVKRDRQGAIVEVTES
jgi:phage portal protein BeeE